VNREAVLTDFDRVLWLVVEKFEASQECSGLVSTVRGFRKLRLARANIYLLSLFLPKGSARGWSGNSPFSLNWQLHRENSNSLTTIMDHVII